MKRRTIFQTLSAGLCLALLEARPVPDCVGARVTSLEGGMVRKRYRTTLVRRLRQDARAKAMEGR